MTTAASIPSAPRAEPLTGWRTLAAAQWGRLAFVGLGALSAVLYLWNLTASGFANSYYSAAALAASQSWSAWFFGALDAGDFITVDKPPLATMLMGLSVRLFGLSSASILVPEALLGVGSVLLLFVIVRRQFGVLAATVAGVVFALTPVAALMFRYDHPDALLTSLMLLAAYGVQRAIENGRHRWLALAGISLGLAFLTKYLQGFLVGPALALAYVVAANASLRRRIVGVFVLGIATFATAGAWVAAVTLIPTDLRPFIGGSTNNSVLDLIFGYDGLGRIFGSGGAGAGIAALGGQNGANFSGTPGLLRLFNSEFGGQIAWFLPVAGLALIGGLWLTRRAPRTDVSRAGYLLWGGWLIVHALVFSFMSGIVHSYYAVAMAPAVAALVGAGVAAAWTHRSSIVVRLAAGAAIVATAALAAVLLWRSPDFAPWLAPVILALAVAAALLLAVPAERGARVAAAGIVLGLVALLAAPAAFTLDTVATAYNGSIVSAGPATTANDVLSGTPADGFSFGGPGRAGFGFAPPGFGPADGTPRNDGAAGGADAGNSTDSALTDYLVANRGSATWIVAVNGAQQAAELELATGLPVMAMGGWSGSDDALSLDQLKADIADGTLRYVLIGNLGGGPGGPGGLGGFGGFGGPSGSTSSELRTWITEHATAVTVPGASTRVYDLSGALGS